MGLRRSKSRRRFRLGPKSELTKAANGHMVLSWPHAGHGFFTLVCLLFRFKYNLRRMGHTAYSPTNGV
jgi:hypothetical protein